MRIVFLIFAYTCNTEGLTANRRCVAWRGMAWHGVAYSGVVVCSHGMVGNLTWGESELKDCTSNCS